MEANSFTKADNKEGVHRWEAWTVVKCHSNDYKGTWVLQAHVPGEYEGLPNNREDDFRGITDEKILIRGKKDGEEDCRISIREASTAGNISGNKIKASESQVGHEVWADSFIPWRVAPGDDPDIPKLGISPADPNQTLQPGDNATFNLVTRAPYYWVDWSVKAPWETSERGTYVEGISGDGTAAETSLSYTFPSGAMHTGDFLITAVIYRWSDMSSYEETYTVTVNMPPD